MDGDTTAFEIVTGEELDRLAELFVPPRKQGETDKTLRDRLRFWLYGLPDSD